jgi:hypothetical protein
VLESSAPLTRKDATVITSRILAAYFLYWTIIDLFNLLSSIYQVLVPLTFFAIPNLQVHNMQRLVIRDLSFSLAKLILTGLAAFYFYKCGSRIARFLLSDSQETASES